MPKLNSKKTPAAFAGPGRAGKRKNPLREALGMWQLYVLLLPGLALLILFHYVPMYGVTVAFKDVIPGESFLAGTWAGLKHFERLFKSPLFGTILKNTVVITFFQHFILWPLPIIFALVVHNCSSRRVRKLSQTASYLPHLVSVVVIVSIIGLFCHQDTGIINIVFKKLGLETVNFIGEEKWFLPMYFTSDVWATLGSSAVIYIAALSAVDPQLIEAATIDGASKLKRIRYVDIPTIMPTIVLLLIMNMGKLLSLGYEKAFLMQNDLNLGVSEIIGTYVYKSGLINQQYGFSAAVSLFNNVIGLALVIATNRIAKKLSDISLF